MDAGFWSVARLRGCSSAIVCQLALASKQPAHNFLSYIWTIVRAVWIDDRVETGRWIG